MFKIEARADSTDKWYSNDFAFETREEAQEYGDRLSLRWPAAREWRVAEIGRPISSAVMGSRL